MIVIADTSPLNYLVLTGYESLLPQLFGSILIPQAVVDELGDAKASQVVRDWIGNPPLWLEVHPAPQLLPALQHLGKGELEGILLAEALHADLLLIDDATAREEAERRSFQVTSTLGVLRLAARQGLIDLPEALSRLRSTSFFVAPSLLERLLREWEQSERS